MSKPLVICVGLNKTGTSSLHLAMHRMGWKCWHGGMAERDDSEIECMLEGEQPRRWQFFSDSPVLWENALALAHAFPKAKFIFTQRTRPDWVSSVIMHKMGARLGKEGFRKSDWTEAYIDEAGLLGQWEANQKEWAKAAPVLRGRLLIMPVGDEENLERLCAFLGQPVPEWEYPHETKGWWR